MVKIDISYKKWRDREEKDFINLILTHRCTSRDEGGHFWVDNTCSVCDYKDCAGSNKGMRYMLSADKKYYILVGLADVMRDFVHMQNCPVFFILELPATETEERRLRKSDTDPFHTDVFYIDGLSADDADEILDSYGELLVADGISSFGFGAHDNSAEIISSKYNVVTVYTAQVQKYSELFLRRGIPLVEHCLTAWDTFTQSCPGESECVKVNGMSVFELPKALARYGIYFAECR